VIEILDDDARIEHAATVFQHQNRHLAERIEAGNGAVWQPGIFDLELERNFLFQQHHAGFAAIGAGERGDEFHAEFDPEVLG